jgi:hypothetical protein
MEAQSNSRYPALSELVKTGQSYAKIHNDYVRQAASMHVARLLQIAAGLGLAGGAAHGLARLVRPRKLSYGRSPVAGRIEIPELAREEDEKTAAFEGLSKSQLAAGAPGFGEGITGSIANAIYNLTGGKSPGALGGAGATSIYGNPWVAGLGIPAAVLLAAGGYTGAKKLMDWRTLEEKEEELEAVREQYQRTVAEGLGTKTASEALDELAEETLPLMEGMKKEAQGDVSNFIGQLGGPMIAYGILSSLIAGKLGYDWARKRDEEKITEEAVARRAMQRAGGTPPAFLTATPAI